MRSASIGKHGEGVTPNVSCLHGHYVVGQDQDNRSIGTRPNQGREPPLIWSVEFMKKVHVASNDTAPLVFPLVVWWNPTFTGSLAMLRYAPRLIESQRLQFEHRAGDIGERRSIRIHDLDATVQCLNGPWCWESSHW